MGAFAKFKNLEFKMREASDQFTCNGVGHDAHPFISIANPYWTVKMDEYHDHTFRVCKVDECVAFLIQFNDREGGIPCVVFNIPGFGTFTLELSEDYDKLFTNNLDNTIVNQTHYGPYWEFGHAAMNFVKYLENNYRVRRNYSGA